MNSKGYKSNAKITLEQEETKKRVIFDIPPDEPDTIAGLLKANNLWGLYADFCILNQEFMSYVVSCNLSKVQLNMVFFLMSEMDRDNKILINNEILVKRLGATEKTIIEAIKKLTEKKIILKQKLGVARYEIQVNYDMINPQLAFKNKATKENVKAHKNLIRQETPYIKQENLFGDIDLLHPDTGEVFYTYPNSNENKKHKLGAKKPPERLTQAAEDVSFEEIEEYPNAEEQEELNRELLKFQEDNKNLSSALMALEEIMEDYTQWEIHNLQANEPNPYEEKKQRLEKLVETLELQLDKKEKYQSKNR
jgi:DNA-binding Lrp family transcriptional regulator